MLLMLHSVLRSTQCLYLMGPQHTATQLRINFIGLRRPKQGGSSEKVLLVNRSLVVTSASQQGLLMAGKCAAESKQKNTVTTGWSSRGVSPQNIQQH